MSDPISEAQQKMVDAAAEGDIDAMEEAQARAQDLIDQQGQGNSNT